MVEVPGCLGCPRSRHKAHLFKSSPLSDSIVVTHPFHLLSGQRLVVILERRRPGTGVVLVCEGGPSGRLTIPALWTDRAPGPLDHRLTVNGLGELAGLVEALQYPHLEHEELS
jgi:hypothetical protein